MSSAVVADATPSADAVRSERSKASQSAAVTRPGGRLPTSDARLRSVIGTAVP
jgi:hypothetical protein